LVALIGVHDLGYPVFCNHFLPRFNRIGDHFILVDPAVDGLASGTGFSFVCRQRDTIHSSSACEALFYTSAIGVRHVSG
jgi:hypothetical protein